MGKVIDLKKYADEVALKNFEKTGDTTYLLSVDIGNYYPSSHPINTLLSNKNNITKYIENENFIISYNNFLENLETNSHKFMFPSILSQYRRGINPVKALYNSLQESVLKYERGDNFYEWVLSLFENKAWYNDLISALKKDIRDAEHILTVHSENHSKRIQLQKKDLAKTLRDFKIALEIFEMLEDWKNDSLTDY